MDESRIDAQSDKWLWIGSIWLAVGLFDATQNVVTMRAEGMHHAWTQLFVMQLLSWLPWALATPIVMGLGRRHPPLQSKAISAYLTHLVACATIGLLSAAWTTWLIELLNPYAKPVSREPFLPLWFDKFYNGLLSFVILYAFILAVTYMLDSRERLSRQQTDTARLNEQLSKAQLNALRRQIEPHSLFNTLNAIAGLVREGRNDAAVSMIAALSDFLRMILKDGTRQLVPLGEEIDFVQKYLDIQKMRFGDRLQVSVVVPSELYPAQVPSLILQPMVENAVKHGIAKRAHGGTIRIAASRLNGMLQVTVYNDGPSLPADWEQTQPGIGISNVRTRLEGLYRDGFELSMRNEGASGVQISVSVPFKEE